MSKRATAVLALMRELDRPYTPYPSHPNYRVTGADFTKDGEWFRLGLVPNIARKTIGQLLEAGAIEQNPGHADEWSILYRLVGNDEWLRQDYGDLWVPFDELTLAPNGQGGPPG